MGTSKRWIVEPFTPDMETYCRAGAGDLNFALRCGTSALKNANYDAEIKSGASA
jgi:hypothetical protein